MTTHDLLSSMGKTTTEHGSPGTMTRERRDGTTGRGTTWTGTRPTPSPVSSQAHVPSPFVSGNALKPVVDSLFPRA